MGLRQKVLRTVVQLAIAGAVVIGFDTTNASAADTIVNGISAGDIDLGGLTKEEAVAKVQDYVAGYTGKSVEFLVDGNSAMATIGELGYYWKNEDIIDDAMKQCKKGNVIERFKERSDMAKEGKKYTLEYDVNNDVMTETINNYCSQFNVPHVNASLTKSGGGFTYTEESTGRIIDMDTTVNQFHDFLLNTWDGNDAQLQVTVVDDYPIATVADCQKVTDVLGTYSTSYSGGSGNYNRNQNIENGARLLNGSVVYPGETFSTNALLEPWTASNGWKEAGTYVNGKVEDSLGGGICQVSTTLYNALLYAEVEIVERYPHSMSVGYVPLSQDAALAGTWKDLKFSNNTDAPIYIESYCSGNSITFNVYGHETRDPSRKLEFISERTGTVAPSEVVTEDPSLPAGYRAVTSKGHTGYSAHLIKRVYENGSLISEEVVNKSTYEASPTYVTVGTGGAASQPESDTPAPEQPSTDVPADTQPATEAPTETQPAETQPAETEPQPTETQPAEPQQDGQ